MQTMAGEVSSYAREKLRSLIKNFEPKPQPEPLAVSWSQKGVRRGGLTEVSGATGSGKTSHIVALLKENPKLKTAWIEEKFSVYPIALLQQGVNLSQILFVEAEKDSSWTALQCIRSQLFEVVVVHTERKLTDVELRRLQLAAEKNSIAVLLLCNEAQVQKSWAVRESIQMTQEKRVLCERSAS